MPTSTSGDSTTPTESISSCVRMKWYQGLFWYVASYRSNTAVHCGLFS